MRSLTLNPGLHAILDAYKSPKMPSNVQDVGKYAKNEGCCQWVKPNRTLALAVQITSHRGKTTWSNKFLVIICDDLEIFAFFWWCHCEGKSEYIKTMTCPCSSEKLTRDLAP